MSDDQRSFCSDLSSVEDEKIIAETSQDSDDMLNSDLKSDFLSSHQPLRRSVRLTSALLNYAHPPGLNLVPLGSAWSLDPIARINNGARRTLLDLFNMIDGMQRRVHDLRTSDLQLFFQWWKLFASFFSTSLQSYNCVVIPWLTSHASLDENAIQEKLSREQMQMHCTTVESMLSSFDKIRDQAGRRAPDETLARIIKAASEVRPIVQFYGAMENELASMIDCHSSPAQAKWLEKRLATFVHKTGAKHLRRMHLHIVVRGMTPESAAAWNKIIPSLVRLSYQGHSSKFQSTYVAVVNKLASV